MWTENQDECPSWRGRVYTSLETNLFGSRSRKIVSRFTAVRNVQRQGEIGNGLTWDRDWVFGDCCVSMLDARQDMEFYLLGELPLDPADILLEDLAVPDLLLHLTRLARIPATECRFMLEYLFQTGINNTYLPNMRRPEVSRSSLWMVLRFFRLYSLARMKTTVLWR